MKPTVLHRGKGSVRFTLVAFRYEYTSSVGYVWGREPEEIGKQVVKFLSEPHSADLISIRKVYVSEEEAQRLEKEKEKEKEKEREKEREKEVDKDQSLIQ